MAYPFPETPPAQAKHPVPENVTEPPFASTRPTCLSSLSGSSSNNRSSVSCAESPVPSRARPRGPKDVLANDWVATAPTPACAHGTTAPTAGNFDATATPQAPSSRSLATIENVMIVPSLTYDYTLRTHRTERNNE